MVERRCQMKIGNTTVRFPESGEPHGRAPRIIIDAEGSLRIVFCAIPYVLSCLAAVMLAWMLHASAAPFWAFVIVLPVIGLGIVKALESRRYAMAYARVHREDS